MKKVPHHLSGTFFIPPIKKVKSEKLPCGLLPEFNFPVFYSATRFESRKLLKSK